MSGLPAAGWGEEVRKRSRSMGVKLLVVCGLALLMTIPALFVSGLVEERSNRAAAVVQEVSGTVGGEQTFLGPMLAVPFHIEPVAKDGVRSEGVYLISPVRGAAVMKTATEERRRSLFRVPVFRADLRMDAAFDLTGGRVGLPERAELEWSRAEVVVGVSDARGALADATAKIGRQTLTLAPVDLALELPPGSQGSKLKLFGAIVGGIAKQDARFDLTANLQFSGARRVAMMAYGKTTHVTAQGDWASPGFDGGFLPVNRSVSEHGFTAEWSVPFMARGVPAEGLPSAMTGLDATAFGISFIEMADPYQSVNRSLKYIPLFLGLVFLAYFVFEVTTGRRVHPAQYILVGLAQLIFYLLLLSIAERIGFDGAFATAGGATVCLLGTNAGWIFESRVQGARALGVFSLLYALIYLLLRLEDNALLVGAVASFTAVAAVMYFTRKIEWYGSPVEKNGLANV